MRNALAALLCAAALLPAAAAEAGDRPPLFRNRASELGLGGRKTIRCLLIDLDGDDWPDAVLDREHVLLNRPAPDGRGRRFVDRTEEAGLRKALAAPDGAFARPSVLIAGDVDNDGDPDLFAGYSLELEKPRKRKGSSELATEDGRLLPAEPDPGVRSRILLNDGSARFSVRPDAGVETPPETTCAAVFVDADRDGRLDLFTGNWYRYYGLSYEAYPDRLWAGRGDGSFRDVTHRAGLLTVGIAGYRNSSRPTYGVAHCDWNNDGRQDLLVAAYGRQWNLLWRNDGGGRFTDVAGPTGFDGDEKRDGAYPPVVRRAPEKPFRSNGNTFDIAPCDYDNDGDIDVFLSEITHWWAGPSSDLSCLLQNRGEEGGYAFERRPDLIQRAGPRAERWNQGDLHAGWLDADNDGLADLVLASSDYPDDQFLRLFLQKPDHSFEDATARAGFGWRNPTGMSFADYDGDGDVDILVGNNNMRLTAEQRQGRVLEAALFENRAGQERNFLSVRLEGAAGSNRGAVGARVWVSAGGTVQMREVYGGGGHAGHQNSPVVHFGLGRARAVEWLRVRWPDEEATTETHPRPGLNRLLHLRQGAEPRVVRDLGPRRATGGEDEAPPGEDF